jgi:hypothetical protein
MLSHKQLALHPDQRSQVTLSVTTICTHVEVRTQYKHHNARCIGCSATIDMLMLYRAGVMLMIYRAGGTCDTCTKWNQGLPCFLTVLLLGEAALLPSDLLVTRWRDI